MIGAMCRRDHAETNVKEEMIMTTGSSFIEILVSEVTMVMGILIFLCCSGLLIAKFKTLSGLARMGIAAVLAISGIYLVFIAYLVIKWG